MEVVVFVGDDIQNYGQAAAVIKKGVWDKSIVIKSQSAQDFSYGDVIVAVDATLPLNDLKNEIMEKLKPVIAGDFEVALSIASGNGKEHMALISALLSLPVGIKFAVFTKQGVEFVN